MKCPIHGNTMEEDGCYECKDEVREAHMAGECNEECPWCEDRADEQKKAHDEGKCGGEDGEACPHCEEVEDV